jgi:hypothetical protein
MSEDEDTSVDVKRRTHFGKLKAVDAELEPPANGERVILPPHDMWNEQPVPARCAGVPA